MLQALPIPAGLGRPADLTTLRFPAAVRLGFEFSWLREVSLGELTGDLGLPIGTGAEIRLAVELTGRFLACVSLDPAGRLTLKITNRSQFPALATRVSAQAPDPQPAHLVELCAAMLLRHQWQWLADVKRRGDTPVFFDRWDALGRRSAAAIWNAAADVRDLDALREWAGRIEAGLRNPASFHQALAAALDAAPDFPCSAAARWIEAAAGSLWAPDFSRLAGSAGRAARLLNEDGLVRMLAGLKQRATAQALASLEGVPRPISGLAAAIYRGGVAALENQYAVELSRLRRSAAGETALLECSFEFTEAGVAACRAALTGDFTTLAPGAARFRLGLLTHGLPGESAINLRLPFIERKYWPAYVATLGQADVRATDDGCVVVTGLWPVPSQMSVPSYPNHDKQTGDDCGGAQPLGAVLNNVAGIAFPERHFGPPCRITGATACHRQESLESPSARSLAQHRTPPAA